jgi:hypothetical protein
MQFREEIHAFLKFRLNLEKCCGTFYIGSTVNGTPLNYGKGLFQASGLVGPGHILESKVSGFPRKVGEVRHSKWERKIYAGYDYLLP